MAVSPPQPLHENHQTDGFDSGEPVFDDCRARANQASGASRTYVVCEDTHVVGYYALASGAMAQASVPGRFRRNMPDPVPWRVAQAANVIGIRGIVAHAISAEARTFYVALGFEPCAADTMTLVVTLQDVLAGLDPNAPAR
ncbi:MAG TPA: hypothetical protein VK789_10365 [Bryobacteraceae bacterium]|nr:hypothetical protein [Bryobacteraceae bacterium]